MEDLQKKDVFDYLATEKEVIISTQAEDGTIDAAAVFFIVDENLNFYFTTKVDTRKYQNMTRNPEVTLTTADAGTLRTIQLKGKAAVLTDLKEVTGHTVSLINKNKTQGMPWAQPIAKLDAGQYVIIKVTPTWLRYGVFLNEEPKGQYFKQII